MDNFVVSFRKYRPDTFSSVVGQPHITETLKNAIRMKQLAQAFLFCGPRGVGKTTCARILAKAVNCKQLTPEGDPCNQCDSCSAFNEGRSMIIHELDAASNNSVEDIRALIDQIRYIPAQDAKAVYIIDEVHMLSSAAFNAFLKTLEEPPPYAIFILATTEKRKILPTILSRCQKFDFRRIRIQDMATHLGNVANKEQIPFEQAALELIALKADGALRDALSLFDQVSAFNNRNITYKAALENLNVLDYEYYFRVQEAIARRDHALALLIYQEVLEKGFDGYNFIAGLLEHFRNLMMAAEPRTVDLLQTSQEVKQRYLDSSRALNSSFMLNAFQLCSDTEMRYRQTANPNLLIELALIKLVYLEDAIQLALQSGNSPDGGPEEKKKSDTPVDDEADRGIVSAPSEMLISAPPHMASPKKNAEVIRIAPEEVGIPAISSEDARQLPSDAKGNARPISMPFARFNSIPKDLEDLNKTLEDEKQAKGHSDSEESVVEFDTDPEVFASAYKMLLEYLETNHKMSLFSELSHEKWTLTKGCWKQQVSDAAMKMILEEERLTLLEFIREKTGYSLLRMEVEIVEQTENGDKKKRPYTAEERLNWLMENYPEMAQFIGSQRGVLLYQKDI
jgi:DNA polymerase-3 subunit gamma/tau